MSTDLTKTDRLFREEDEYFYDAITAAEQIDSLIEYATFDSWWEKLPL